MGEGHSQAPTARRVREGVFLATPLHPIELAKSLAPETVKDPFGPLQAKALATEFRAVVRERRKLKQPHEDVLRALYGACVMADLVDSLLFEGAQPHHMAEFVARPNSRRFSSTTQRWATSALRPWARPTSSGWSRPSVSRRRRCPFNAAWPAVWQNAISRKCWAELAHHKRNFGVFHTARSVDAGLVE